MAKECKHNHECESCVREKLALAEAKVKELKAKLPQQIVINNICNGHCNNLHCYHWKTNLLNYPYQWPSSGSGITNAIGTMQSNTISTAGYMRVIDNDNKATGQ